MSLYAGGSVAWHQTAGYVRQGRKVEPIAFPSKIINHIVKLTRTRSGPDKKRKYLGEWWKYKIHCSFKSRFNFFNCYTISGCKKYVMQLCYLYLNKRPFYGGNGLGKVRRRAKDWRTRETTAPANTTWILCWAPNNCTCRKSGLPNTLHYPIGCEWWK